MPEERRRFEVPAALAGGRLDHVLDVLVEGLTRAQLQKLVRRGRVRVDGRRVKRSNVKVSGKAEILLELGEPAPREPSPARVEILHEDDAILVVDKPAGMLTHPAPRSTRASVSEELVERYGDLPAPFGAERPGIVHRLDRETSGLLVVGRTESAMYALKDQFRAQRVEKTYLALVSNVPPETSFVIDEPIGPVAGKADRQGVSSAGKSATTHFERTEAFEAHALIACRPRTGRRHQIRVHLAFRGWPVVGDSLYGTRRQRPLPAGAPPLSRHALHAHRLAFDHPESGERVAYECRPARDLEDTLGHLRR